MPNNPVQIILNDDAFLRAPEPGRRSTEKDFFEGNDNGFIAHRDALASSIDAISKTIQSSPYGPAAYLRIRMRPEALAKSYRPNTALFTSDNFPCVGAGGVGTLYFRAPLIYLARLKARIESAEDRVEVKINRRTGKPYKAPTRYRSEVSAIDTLEIAPASEKRQFSTADAIAMMRDPATVSGYMVELFETPDDRVIADDPLGRSALLSSLEETFRGFGAGMQAFMAPPIGRTPVLEFQLTRSEQPAFLENRRDFTMGQVQLRPVRTELDYSDDRHEAVLSKLASHPLVRTIRPPVQLALADSEQSNPSNLAAALPAPSAEATYPIIGVIDSGISGVLEDWLVGRFDYLDRDECDAEHGTKVGALIVAGQSFNAATVANEPNGCRIYDAALYPSEPFLSAYPKGFTDFMEEVEQAVIEGKDHGVRIFNLSINARLDVEPNRYSIYAARLDEIADRHGVIFVNSAGNLPPQEARTPWQSKPGDVVKYFANRTQPDTILKPAESVRSISVGALNPPGTEHLADAPTVYTRRGPGLQVGVKPDLATYGGAGVGPSKSSGLKSIDSSGQFVDLMGTSYAAPLVARTMAGLDAMTEGGLESEALRAMLLHSATMPYPLTRRGIKNSIDRQFAGFGKPKSADELLQTDDHQITMLFQSRLTVGERRPAILRFPFQWPASLVDPATGACSGIARMTLVFSPPLDPAFGAEFVRINLDASLRQRQPGLRSDGTPSFTNQINARYLPNAAGLGIPERALITHGLKWWPNKQYESNFTEHGVSSEWRLEVSSLVRAEARFPPEGIPFAVLLTLEDKDGMRPIFQEMRQTLQSSIANAVDIRTATRIRPRS